MMLQLWEPGGNHGSWVNVWFTITTAVRDTVVRWPDLFEHCGARVRFVALTTNVPINKKKKGFWFTKVIMQCRFEPQIYVW